MPFTSLHTETLHYNGDRKAHLANTQDLGETLPMLLVPVWTLRGPGGMKAAHHTDGTLGYPLQSVKHPTMTDED